MQLFDWNIAAASNNSAPPDGAPENMEYDEVNDTMREFMAVLARFYQSGVSGTKATGGTTTAYTLTTDYSISAYEAGQVFSFTAHATSTGAVTLNVDAQGAGNVVDARGVQLGAGDIVNGGFYLVRRTSGGTFMLLGALSASSVAAAAGVTLTSAFLAGGTADAITITASPALTAYANGQMIAFRANATNTGAMTINVSGLGAEALEDYRSAALAAGDVTSGRAYLAVRTGGEWRIIAGLPVDAANDLVGVVPVANGGTNAATAADARTNLGLAIGSAVQAWDANLDQVAALTPTSGNLIVGNGSAWTSAAPSFASAAQMEAGSSLVVFVSPGIQNRHHAHPKAGGNFNGQGTPAFAAGDVGMGAITDNGTGAYTFALDTAFEDTNYWQTVFARDDSTANSYVSATSSGTKTATAFQVQVRDSNNTNQDTPEGGITFWGNYA